VAVAGLTSLQTPQIEHAQLLWEGTVQLLVDRRPRLTRPYRQAAKLEQRIDRLISEPGTFIFPATLLTAL
jgi:hypothetical protein